MFTHYNKTLAVLALLVSIPMLMMSFTGSDEEKTTAWYEDKEALMHDYKKSLAEAQKYDSSRVSTTLMPVSQDNEQTEWAEVNGKKMVLVCTMTNKSSLRFWTSDDIYHLSKETGIWVTLPADWRRRANQFAGMDSVASRYRMIQMLGLWPGCDYDTVVEFYADPDYIFRPAFDPTITTTTSGVSFPDWADASYTVGETNFREWFAMQASMVYKGDYACPWTCFGYTYDWHRGAPREGLSEYVATYGTTAKIKRRLSFWDFLNTYIR